jgi:hypothetical protein
MRRHLALVWLSGLTATVAACGGSPTASAPPAPPKPVAMPAPAPAAPGTPSPAVPSTPGTQAAAVPSTPGAPSASVPSTPGAEAPRLVPATPELPTADVPDYEVRGRRDPFAMLDVVSGPTGLTVASTRLTGIIRSGQSALALLETSDGIGYILKPGDTLGDGRLVEVSADTAVFAVAARPGAPVNRVVLRLAAN